MGKQAKTQEKVIKKRHKKKAIAKAKKGAKTVTKTVTLKPKLGSFSKNLKKSKRKRPKRAKRPKNPVPNSNIALKKQVQPQLKKLPTKLVAQSKNNKTKSLKKSPSCPKLK